MTTPGNEIKKTVSANSDLSHYVAPTDFPLARALSPEERIVAEKKLKRKLDARNSIFIAIYIMNYLDRNNLGAAKSETSLFADLGLDETKFATCLSILYVGYILMQVPSNMVVNKISRPSWYIGAAMTIWGMLSVLAGVVKTYEALVGVRFCLGFVEAAFLPGALLILSKWYTRRELTLRNALLFAGNLISNAFSSLVAAGVLWNLDGALGHAGWRWLFYIEGAATMFIAILAMVILPDLPSNTKGFTDVERELAELRLAEDVGESDKDADNQGVFDGLLMAVKDIKIYIMMIVLTAYVVGLSFNSYFPTLTKVLGFSRVPTLLMSAPPWVFSVIVSMINAWHSDKTQEKFYHIAWPIVMGIVGFVISMATRQVAARYVSLFLQAGSYAGFIVFYSWISSSFPRPPAKRAVALAMINAFSQLGNIAGSYVWGDLKRNSFRPAYGVVLSMFLLTLIGCFVFKLILVKENKALEALELEAAQGDAPHHKAGVATAHVEGGDVEAAPAVHHKGFRYLV